MLTRTEVLDVRLLVTVAEISTSARGLAVEVGFDHESVGLARHSVINCDGLRTIAQSTLTERVGTVDEATMAKVCAAVSYAVGADHPSLRCARTPARRASGPA